VAKQTHSSEDEILDSWHRNALPWAEAIRDEKIESRRLVTNRAIVDAILDRSPRTVLDIGCGEGWLVRALSGHGMRVTGIDAVPALVEKARSSGGGEFHVATYDDISAGRFNIAVDVAVCNFSLLGDESVDEVFRAVPRLLNKGGVFMVQTLHPVACGELPYQDGWRSGSWAGFGSEFTDPAPWYFRTLESWKALFLRHGFPSIGIREPLHPVTGHPASVIFIAGMV